MVTAYPSSISRMVAWEPMNPAPPVTSTWPGKGRPSPPERDREVSPPSLEEAKYKNRVRNSASAPTRSVLTLDAMPREPRRGADASARRPPLRLIAGESRVPATTRERVSRHARGRGSNRHDGFSCSEIPMPRFDISPIAHSCASRLLVGAYRGSRTSDPMNLRRQAQRRRPPHRRGGTVPSSTPPSPRPDTPPRTPPPAPSPPPRTRNPPRLRPLPSLPRRLRSSPRAAPPLAQPPTSPASPR